jgi:hypothetical protein
MDLPLTEQLNNFVIYDYSIIRESKKSFYKTAINNHRADKYELAHRILMLIDENFVLSKIGHENLTILVNLYRALKKLDK